MFLILIVLFMLKVLLEKLFVCIIQTVLVNDGYTEFFVVIFVSEYSMVLQLVWHDFNNMMTDIFVDVFFS